MALLPMKGHSQRVPRKNLRLFRGKPLYHRIVESLLRASRVSGIAIDTDSAEIAEDARKHFREIRILDRPRELLGDEVPMNSIIAHDIAQSDGEHFLQTHSTNPLLSAETIDRAVAAYFESLGRFDSLFSVTRIQSRLYESSGKAINHNPEELLPTQLLDPVFMENSCLFVFSKASFRAAGNRRIGKKPKLFETPRLESVDIDEESDFEIAELLFAAKKPCP